MSTTPEPVLAAKKLALIRGGRELFTNLSFQLWAGNLVQIEGANGAGKTSLLRILAGLSRYGFEGTVSVDVPCLYLGHNSAVKAMLSPRENLSLHVSGRNDNSGQDIDGALDRVGLYVYEDVLCHTLSAGQLRRVNLARLFLSDCPLWFLDEPFTAIDKAGVAELELLFVRHVQAGGAIVMTSHQTLSLSYPVRTLDLIGGMSDE